MMRRIALAGTMLLALCAGTQAADQVKLGFITPLSGPISPAGAETKRGADLALEELGNKLGGLPVRYTVVDDKTNPAEAVQGASKLIDDAKVDFTTGFSCLQYHDPDLEDLQRCRYFYCGGAGRPVAVRRQGMPPERLRRVVLERRLAGCHGQVHVGQGDQERVFPRRRLSGRLRARRRRYEIFQRQVPRPGLHAARPARLCSRDRSHPRGKTGRSVRVPGRSRRRRLHQAICPGGPAEADSRSTPRIPLPIR